MVVNVELYLDFCEVFYYNNVIYMIVGVVVGKVVKIDWDFLFREWIFDFFKMENMNFLFDVV